MKTDHKKERMILSRSIRRRRRYIEVAFGNNDAARLLLSKEKGVLFESDKAYCQQKTLFWQSSSTVM